MTLLAPPQTRVGVIERYRARLPVTDRTPVITLQEGSTPLLRGRNLERHLSFSGEIYLKCEGFNPTGSFKDRGMTVAISKAVENGARVVLSASTGNTAASAAAYAARAGIACAVVLPAGAIARGKLSQALLHGAKVLAIRGNFDEALALVREVARAYPVTLVNSLNPDRIEGQKTAAFEIVDALGDAPDFQFMPVGNAGNITAYWKGYKEYHADGAASHLPKMIGLQASGAAPIVRGRPISNPKTVATAIRIGNPASWRFAEEARDESGGAIEAISDAEILAAYRLIGRLEGVFCEPASAASVAGLVRWVRARRLPAGSRVVCILTGHGLKDPESAMRGAARPKTVAAKADKIAAALGL